MPARRARRTRSTRCADAKSLIGLLLAARAALTSADLARARDDARGGQNAARHGDRRRRAAARSDDQAKAEAGARFEGLVLDFLAYLELERGLSRNTLNAYRTDLLQYGEFLAGRDGDALAAGPGDVSEFLAELATGNGRPPCSAATIHRKAACLRSFYKHLRREELIDEDPTAALSAPRRARKLPQVLNYAEVQRLLAAPRGSEPTALRDRALLEVMYACGLRASETIGLELSDVDLRRGFLRAHGKGSKERLVPLGRQGGGRGQRLPAGRPPEAGRRSGRSRSSSSTSAAGR